MNSHTKKSFLLCEIFEKVGNFVRSLTFTYVCDSVDQFSCCSKHKIINNIPLYSQTRVRYVNKNFLIPYRMLTRMLKILLKLEEKNVCSNYFVLYEYCVIRINNESLKTRLNDSSFQLSLLSS